MLNSVSLVSDLEKVYFFIFSLKLIIILAGCRREILLNW